MNDLVSYLLAQAKYRPVATAKFTSHEIWRRGRLRLLDSLEHDLPSFSSYLLRSRFQPFYPARALEAAAFGSHFLRAAETALERAEEIHRHEFEIFGERFDCGTEIDWHRDPKTGHRWPLRSAGELRIVHAAGGADVKRPWELARFHHLLPLGKAYLLTRERRHADEFARQILDWVKENPYPRGIHWAMPMEAAIRAVNWIAAAAFFAAEEALDEPFWQEFLRTLFLHGRFVYAHREWNPVARGNHYLACVVGLLHLGVLFADKPEAQRWLRFARREFLREMNAQVREDGVAHEGSSGYHIFLTEMFLTGAMFLVRVDAKEENSGDLKVAATDEIKSRPFASLGTSKMPAVQKEIRGPEAWAQLAESCGKPFTARLEKMFEFIAALAAGRERAPILGDADDGRLLPYCAAEADAAAHLLSVGRALFRRSDWPGDSHGCEEVWWRLGRGPEMFLNSPGNVPAESAAFHHSGYFFFASPRLRGSVRCGPLGINGWANHAHCDQLNVEFCWDGKPVVVDPGTYLYSGSAAERNLFRSTRAHNTVMVDGEEQNRFWPGLLFRMVDDTRSNAKMWRAGAERVEFIGEHSGYRRLRGRVGVTRRVALDSPCEMLVISDSLRGTGTHQLEWFFHLAPGIAPERVEKWPGDLVALPELAPEAAGFLFQAAWRVGPMLLVAAAPEKVQLETKLESGWVAPRYGRREEAAVVRFSCEVKLPVSVGFAFLAADKS